MYLWMVQQFGKGFFGRHAPSAWIEIRIQRNRIPSGATVVAPEGCVFRLMGQIHPVFVIAAVRTPRLHLIIAERTGLDV